MAHSTTPKVRQAIEMLGVPEKDLAYVSALTSVYEYDNGAVSIVIHAQLKDGLRHTGWANKLAEDE